ncbi:hypothetical protein ACA910_013721 [Epithemia clementina (nom. ined.)]
MFGYHLMWQQTFLLFWLPPGNLFQGRPQHLFFPVYHSSFWQVLYMLSPLVHVDTRAMLYDRLYSGQMFSLFSAASSSNHRVVEWYDPNRHNTAYRQVETNVITPDECQVLRHVLNQWEQDHVMNQYWTKVGTQQSDAEVQSLLRGTDQWRLLNPDNVHQQSNNIEYYDDDYSKNNNSTDIGDQKNDDGGNDDEGNDDEDSNDTSTPIIMAQYPPPSFTRLSDYEQEVVYQTMSTIQQHVESFTQNPNVVVDLAEAVVQRSFVEKTQTWWYETSGGHDMHADNCKFQTMDANDDDDNDDDNDGDERNNKKKKLKHQVTWWNWWMPKPSVYSPWNHPTKCAATKRHCCTRRTHTAVLYLNDPSSDLIQTGQEEPLVGGELYLIHRHDLPDDNDNDHDSNNNNGGDASYFTGAPLSEQVQHVLKVPPTCGTLALFTSNSRNIHGTLPLKQGVRYHWPTFWISDRHVPTALLDDQSLCLAQERVQAMCDSVSSSSMSEGGNDRRMSHYPPPTGLQQAGGDCQAWLQNLRPEVRPTEQKNKKEADDDDKP